MRGWRDRARAKNLSRKVSWSAGTLRQTVRLPAELLSAHPRRSNASKRCMLIGCTTGMPKIQSTLLFSKCELSFQKCLVEPETVGEKNSIRPGAPFAHGKGKWHIVAGSKASDSGGPR